MTLVALSLLVAAAWALGRAAVRSPWSDLRGYERAALTLTAGLGLVALLLSLVALAGAFRYSVVLLGCLGAAGGVVAVRDVVRRAPDPPRASSPRWARVLHVALLVAALLGCLGAIAPVTDEDALAYVLPIARHIATEGTLRVFPDQARSMWPESQQVMLAFMMRLGGDRLGALSALEWLLAFGAVSALVRRACEREAHHAAAMVLALGAPVLAFQIASSKEDLFLLAASAAAAACVIGPGGDAELAAAGLLAGIAAGAKYPGLGVAAAFVAWTAFARRVRRLRAVAVIASAALAAGGLWYGLNLWRFGNPVAPFVFGAPGTPLTAHLVRAFNEGFGVGYGPLAFLLAPIRIFTEPWPFAGRSGWFNPLVYTGLGGLFIASARRLSGPLFFAAGVVYIGWFFSLQNARLLLPVAVMLAPSAADRLVPFVAARRWLQPAAWSVAALSIAIVAVVGPIRLERYARDPGTYLDRESAHYADIRWMNAHLDHLHDRVGSEHKVLAYLEVPSLFLDANYELEISDAEQDDGPRLLAACRRQGITYLYGRPDSFGGMRPHLRLVYENPASRIGGSTFFREPPTEATAVFEILDR